MKLMPLNKAALVCKQKYTKTAIFLEGITYNMLLIFSIALSIAFCVTALFSAIEM